MIITLCGSARFEAAFHHWNEVLTLQGHTVFSLSVFPSTKGKKNWYDTATKIKLDAAHKRKIVASDAIFVITNGINSKDRPYIGTSTKSEIDFARQENKIILWQ